MTIAGFVKIRNLESTEEGGKVVEGGFCRHPEPFVTRQNMDLYVVGQSGGGVAKSFADNAFKTVAQVRLAEFARDSDAEAGSGVFAAPVAKNQGRTHPLLALQKSLEFSLFQEAGLLGKG